MPLTVQLLPRLGDPHEKLQHGISERPKLSFSSSDMSAGMWIGRGSVTGISDPAISRAAFRLSFDANCLARQQVRATLRDGPQSNLYVNGLPWEETQAHVYLSHGDIVSLDGLRYKYKVHIFKGPEQRLPLEVPNAERNSKRKYQQQQQQQVLGIVTTDLTTSSSSPKDLDVKKSIVVSQGHVDDAPRLVNTLTVTSSHSVAVPDVTAKQLAEEIQCSICLDIQVFPRALNPCGHSFCARCLEGVHICPQCRQPIESHLPARQVESLIDALVTIPNFVEKDDLKQFEKRRSKLSKIVSTEREPLVQFLYLSFHQLTFSNSPSQLIRHHPPNAPNRQGILPVVGQFQLSLDQWHSSLLCILLGTQHRTMPHEVVVDLFHIILLPISYKGEGQMMMPFILTDVFLQCRLMKKT